MASLYLALHNDAEQAAAWLPAAPAAEKGGLGGGGPAADDTAAAAAAAGSGGAAAGSSTSQPLTDEELTSLLRVLLSGDGAEADTNPNPSLDPQP